MTYAQALTPNNIMANNLSNSMNNIKLDTTVDPAETYMRIEKHHPSTDSYQKKENKEETPVNIYKPEAPVVNQNYSMAQYQTQQMQPDIMQAQNQYPKMQVPPDYSQYYQQQYYTPMAQQYQTYQAPAQYSQMQNLPPVY